MGGLTGTGTNPQRKLFGVRDQSRFCSALLTVLSRTSRKLATFRSLTLSSHQQPQAPYFGRADGQVDGLDSRQASG